VYLDEGEVTQIPTKQPKTTTVTSAVFTQTLKLGMENSDVRRLQQLLATNQSIYPEAITTGYYGTLTQRAVQRFQAKYGIASSGTPQTTGYGLVGPATRAKLAEVFAGTAPKAPEVAQPAQKAAAVSPIFTKWLERGMSHPDIKRLQQLLNTDTDTQISQTGVGSPGNETDYFGSLTEKAVQRFQKKYGVAKEGDIGYGYVGPATRAKLGEIFGGSIQPTPTQGTSAEKALQTQIEELLKQIQIIQEQIQAAQ